MTLTEWSDVTGICRFKDGVCRFGCVAGMWVNVFTQARGWHTVHTKMRICARREFAGCGDLVSRNDDWKSGEMGPQVFLVQSPWGRLLGMDVWRRRREEGGSLVHGAFSEETFLAFVCFFPFLHPELFLWCSRLGCAMFGGDGELMKMWELGVGFGKQTADMST